MDVDDDDIDYNKIFTNSGDLNVLYLSDDEYYDDEEEEEEVDVEHLLELVPDPKKMELDREEEEAILPPSIEKRRLMKQIKEIEEKDKKLPLRQFPEDLDIQAEEFKNQMENMYSFAQTIPLRDNEEVSLVNLCTSLKNYVKDHPNDAMKYDIILFCKFNFFIYPTDEAIREHYKEKSDRLIKRLKYMEWVAKILYFVYTRPNLRRHCFLFNGEIQKTIQYYGTTTIDKFEDEWLDKFFTGLHRLVYNDKKDEADYIKIWESGIQYISNVIKELKEPYYQRVIKQSICLKCKLPKLKGRSGDGSYC